MGTGTDLLLDPEARYSLAHWLRGKPRIPEIDRTVWCGLLSGSRALITFVELSALVDRCGAGVLDVVGRPDLGEAPTRPLDRRPNHSSDQFWFLTE